MSRKLCSESSDALSYFKEQSECKPDQSEHTNQLQELLMSSPKYTNHASDFFQIPVNGNISNVEPTSFHNNDIEDLSPNIPSLTHDTIVIDECTPSITETQTIIVDLPTHTELSLTQCLPQSQNNNSSKLDANIVNEGISKLDTHSLKSSHESIIQGKDDNSSSLKSSSSTLIAFNSNPEGNRFSIQTKKHGSFLCIKDNSLCIDLIDGEDIATATVRIFKPKQVFESLTGLIDHLSAFGYERGFKITRYGSSLSCNRCYLKGKKRGTHVSENSCRCGCEYQILFRFIERTKQQKTDPVIITKVHPNHTNGCQPNENQLVLQRTRAGDYAKFSLLTMKDLMSMMDLKSHVDADIIRAMLLRAFPGRKGISKHDIRNARLRCQMLQKKIIQSGDTIESFKYDHSQVKGLLKGIDDNNDDIIDFAIQSSKEIYLKYLHDDSCRTKLLAILDKLGRKDSGFTYNVSFDIDGKLTGFVYMTSVMRANLIRFGSFICLDAMKRRTNVHMWPYIGPTVMNDLKKSVVCCESFVLEERHDAYAFVLSSMFDMAPQFPRENLKVIFGDEFLTEKILEDCGLNHTKLFYDHFHLKKTYEKQIGPSYNRFSGWIHKILEAHDESSYDIYCELALTHVDGKHSKFIDVINDLMLRRKNFAGYIIDSTSGSCCHRGSTRAEQNHSSVMSHIGKDYVGELEEILLLLLKRQMNKTLQDNNQLSKEYFSSRIISTPDTSIDPNNILVQAKNNLCEFGYEMFKGSFTQANHYKYKLYSNGQTHVFRIGKQDKPRVFLDKSHRCTCKMAVSNEQQCAHEIVLLNYFDLNRFSHRWRIREGITTNSDKGRYINPNCLDLYEIDISEFSSKLFIEDNSSCPNPIRTTLTESPSGSVSNFDNIESYSIANCNEDITEPAALDNNFLNTDIFNAFDENSNSNEVFEIPTSNSNKKETLSFTSFMQVANQLFSAAQKNTQYKAVVSGFMLQLLETVKTGTEKEFNLNEVENDCKFLAKKYNSTFNSINDFHGKKITTTDGSTDPSMRPKPTLIQNYERKRLMSHIEQKQSAAKKHHDNAKHYIRSKKKAPNSCTFCKQNTHRKTNCPRKDEIGDVISGTELIHTIMNTAPFGIATPEDSTYIINNMDWKEVCHMKVHFIKTRYNPGITRPEIHSMFAKISCYSKFATLIPGKSPCLVDLREVIQFITVKSKIKTSLFFSSIRNESIGPSFQNASSSQQLIYVQPNTQQSLSQLTFE